MTKKTKATVAKADPKTAKTAAVANKVDMTFGTWLKTVARARAPMNLLFADFPHDKIEDGLTVDAAKKRKMGKHAQFELAVTRYTAFLKRGSQAGMKSRAKAA